MKPQTSPCAQPSVQGHAAQADDDCGRIPPESRPMSSMSLEQTMASIDAACPNRVFLVKGAECCVCLDSFGSAAETAVAKGGSGEHVAKLLRSLNPPITPLRCDCMPIRKYYAARYTHVPSSPSRCGHVLHRSCALQVMHFESCILCVILYWLAVKACAQVVETAASRHLRCPLCRRARQRVRRRLSLTRCAESP